MFDDFWLGMVVGFFCGIVAWVVANEVIKWMARDEDEPPISHIAPVNEGYDGWNTMSKPEPLVDPADRPLAFKKPVRKRSPRTKKSR